MMKWLKIFILLFLSFFWLQPAYSFWIWTPETNQWVNPKYSVRDTPPEQLSYALKFYQAKDYKRTIQEMRRLVKYYPKSKEAPEAKYYIGLCFEEQDNLLEAYRSYQEVIDKYPFSERSAEVVKREYDIGNKLLEAKGNRGKFIEGLTGIDYNVVEIFKTVIKNAPYGEFAAPSQYKIGLYFQGKEQYQEARDAFEKTINDYPESEWAKAAKYQIALSDAKRSSDPQHDQKTTQSAVSEFKDFVDAHPDADLTDDAKEHIQKLREKEAENQFVIAQFYEKQKNYKAARLYYNSIIKDYENTVWATKALNKVKSLKQ